MNRSTLTTVDVGEGKKRYRVVFQTDECAPNTQLSRYLQFELLKAIATDPAMAQLGNNDFQTMAMSHNGSAWIVTLEAVA